MVGTFFAWAIPLLMIVAGCGAALAGALAASGWNAPKAGQRIGLFAWSGIVVAVIGLVLTGVNLWELFR